MLSCPRVKRGLWDAMMSDTRPTTPEPQYKRLLQASASMTGSNYDRTAPATKTITGDWYLDELGNPTREIKAAG
jgi:hypothetical protein